MQFKPFNENHSYCSKCVTRKQHFESGLNYMWNYGIINIILTEFIIKGLNQSANGRDRATLHEKNNLYE